LVEPGNSQDLAEKIGIALDMEWDDWNIKNYGNNFTWENISERILNVYSSIKNK
jgi:glycosyltransferase involved in cell wall biosynthesis